MSDQLRADFEESMRAQLAAEGYSQHASNSVMERASGGWYTSIRVNGAWWGWVAACKYYAGADERTNMIARNGNTGEHYDQ